MAEKNSGAEWAIRVLLVITALAVGFGVSQIAIAGDVRVNTTRIDMIIQYQEKTIGLLEEIVKQNRTVISDRARRSK